MRYTPKPLPEKPEIWREFQRVSDSMKTIHQHDVLHTAPDKAKIGLVVYADGTDWNPGSGEGLYVYTSAGWVKL